jgi:hypothetical protein
MKASLSAALRRRWVPPLALAAAITACRARDGGAPTQPQPQPQPIFRAISFRNDVLPVIARNCATAEGCHGSKPTDSIDLDLRAEAAYSQLVGAAAEVRKGALRIKPGDPAASFLVNKLEGSLRSGEGKQMPIDVETGAPLSPSPLPRDYVEKVLKPWIEAGAPNN